VKQIGELKFLKEQRNKLEYKKIFTCGFLLDNYFDLPNCKFVKDLKSSLDFEGGDKLNKHRRNICNILLNNKGTKEFIFKDSSYGIEEELKLKNGSDKIIQFMQL